MFYLGWGMEQKLRQHLCHTLRIYNGLAMQNWEVVECKENLQRWCDYSLVKPGELEFTRAMRRSA